MSEAMLPKKRCKPPAYQKGGRVRREGGNVENRGAGKKQGHVGMLLREEGGGVVQPRAGKREKIPATISSVI